MSVVVRVEVKSRRAAGADIPTAQVRDIAILRGSLGLVQAFDTVAFDSRSSAAAPTKERI